MSIQYVNLEDTITEKGKLLMFDSIDYDCLPSNPLFSLEGLGEIKWNDWVRMIHFRLSERAGENLSDTELNDVFDEVRKDIFAKDKEILEEGEGEEENYYYERQAFFHDFLAKNG